VTALELANVNPELSVAEWGPEILSKERPADTSRYAPFTKAPYGL
jgi:hypothetical protein